MHTHATYTNVNIKIITKDLRALATKNLGHYKSSTMTVTGRLLYLYLITKYKV